jgi:hypothetical protein
MSAQSPVKGIWKPKSVRVPLWVGLGFILIASLAAARIIAEVGDRCDFIGLPCRASYVWFLAAYTCGVVCLIRVWLCSLPVTGSHHLPLAFAVLGFAPDWGFVALCAASNDRAFTVIAMAANWLEMPGQLLHAALLGETFCRWCEGLIDAPVRSMLLSVMLVSGFNAAATTMVPVLTKAIYRAAFRRRVGAPTASATREVSR